MAPLKPMRRTLQEITQRVEAALSHYEDMEESDPARFGELRREDQAEATLGDLAEAGRARIDLVFVAMAEIATERDALLAAFKAKLEQERQNADQMEKDEVSGR